MKQPKKDRSIESAQTYLKQLGDRIAERKKVLGAPKVSSDQLEAMFRNQLRTKQFSK
jgi:hypothetical protein